MGSSNDLKPNFLRILFSPLAFLLALFLVFEEWLWDQLQNLGRWIAKLPPFAELEKWLRTLAPIPSLLILATPSLLLIPIKILAISFIAHGKAKTGILFIIGAKVTGTAVVARLFDITKPKVLTLPWFLFVYTIIMTGLNWAKTQIHQSWAYQMTKLILRKLRSRFFK